MGGLHIIGTERHESRRIDNQLRGRSGRQGDPGSSRFYLSLEDNLMRIFGDPERIKRLLSRAGMKEGEAIESKLLSRQIERAQRKVEAHNFDIRKQLLEYDDVANDQRKVVYQQRAELMDAEDISDAVRAIRAEVVNDGRHEHVPRRERRGDVGQGRPRQGARARVRRALRRSQGARAGPPRSTRRRCARGSWPRRSKSTRRRRPRSGRSSCTTSRRRSCSASSTRTGRSTSARSTTCARASTCAATRSAIRSRSTSARRSRCSAAMLERVKHDTISILSKIQIRRPEDVQAIEPEMPDPAHASVPARGRAVARRGASASGARRDAGRRARRRGPLAAARGSRGARRALRARAAEGRAQRSRARAAPGRNSSSATAGSADRVSRRRAAARARRPDRRRARPLAREPAAARHGPRGFVGISGRQAPCGRDAVRGAAPRARRGARHRGARGRAVARACPRLSRQTRAARCMARARLSRRGHVLARGSRSTGSQAERLGALPLLPADLPIVAALLREDRGSQQIASRKRTSWLT